MAAIRLGELLTSKGLLNNEQLLVAMSQQSITGTLLGETLIKLGFVSSKEVARSLSEQTGIDFIDLNYHAISDDALRLIPRETARSNSFLPLTLEDGVVSIGIIDPSNIRAIDVARKISRKQPKVFMIDSDSYYESLEKKYYFLEHPITEQINKISIEIRDAESLKVSTIATLTDLLIMDAIRRNATDIHINPAEEAIHISYRIDGVLHHINCLSKKIQNSIVSRVKILSELDIAEQRLPQDGSFTFPFLNKYYEMRVSVVPTIYGENTVIRILSGTKSLLSLTALGYTEDETKLLRRLSLKPHGMIIVAGPTGSGKTTTLYAALREINLIQKNVLTVEDPVEYKLNLVKQTSISEKAGYSFALAGKSFMRQDPDVILLGEIRDEETAQIAIRASITGHLMLSTLHTNDAVTSIPRIIDLNVDKFLLSSALLAVIAQRLVRVICGQCKHEYEVTPDELDMMGVPDLTEKIKTAYRGDGCSACNNTGYRGRTCIGEVLEVTDTIREMIYTGASVKDIQIVAVRNGMVTMRNNGIRKAIEGITTFEEVLRVAG